MKWTVEILGNVVHQDRGCDTATGAVSWSGHYYEVGPHPGYDSPDRLEYHKSEFIAIDEYRDSFIQQAQCRYEKREGDPLYPGVQPAGWIVIAGVLVAMDCYLYQEYKGREYAWADGTFFRDCSNWMPRWTHDVRLPSIPDPHSALAPIIPGGDYSNPSNDPIAQGPMNDAESFGDMIRTALSLGTLGINGEPESGVLCGWASGSVD